MSTVVLQLFSLVMVIVLKNKKTILSHKTILDALADESNNFPKAAIKPKELLIIRVDSVSSFTARHNNSNSDIALMNHPLLLKLIFFLYFLLKKQNMFWMKHHPSSVV